MTKLETLIKLNSLEKQNRRNRLENKLKQQENYVDIEDLASSEQTLRAIDWQNQELDKQTKMIQQAGFQIGETASRIGENTSRINETLKGTIKETHDTAPVFVDTKTAKILHKFLH